MKGSIFNDESSMTIERRRYYRYAIPQELKSKYTVIFKLPSIPSFERPIINLNQEAVAISLEKDDNQYIADQTEFAITLKMDNDMIELCQTLLIRSSAQVTVLSFKNLTPADIQVLKRHFPILLGHSLKVMEIRSTSPKFPAVWYHGDNNTDLFLWGPSQEAFNRCVFSFEDSIVEWKKETGPKTGRVLRETFIQSLDFVKRQEPPKTYDPWPKRETLDYALEIVGSSVIDASCKAFLRNILSGEKK